MNANASKSSKQGFKDDLSIHDSNQSMPLNVGELGDEQVLDPLANVRERSKFNGGSIVLIAVIVLALAGLWFMRAITKVSASTGKNTEIEKVIEGWFQRQKVAKPTDPTIGNTDPNVLTLLSSSYTERQVPLDQVQRNPFILPGEGLKLDTTTGQVDKDYEKRLTTRKSELVKAQAKLQLKTVMMASEPLASISGKIVRKGDEITIDPENVTFRVTNIAPDTVELIAEDAEFDITHSVTLTIER